MLNYFLARCSDYQAWSHSKLIIHLFCHIPQRASELPPMETHLCQYETIRATAA